MRRIFSLLAKHQKKLFWLALLFLPVFLVAPFFLTSQFILLDDHEIYRLHFGELNLVSAILDDWHSLNRFRPFYWVMRQVQSLLFGVSPFGWYASTLLLFALTLLFFFLFLKKLPLNKFTAVILTWCAFLGYHSINSWIALGPQEGFALCLFSFSLVACLKYKKTLSKTWLLVCFLSFFASVLTKETFIFTLLAPLLFLHSEKNSALDKKVVILFLSIPLLLAPIYLFKSMTLAEEKHRLVELSHFTLPHPRTLLPFIKNLFSSYSILFASIIGVGLATYQMTKKFQVSFLVKVLLLLAMISAQVMIFSYTDYIAPHYIQPLYTLIILFLAYVCSKFHSTFSLGVGLALLITIPVSLTQTLITANSHNFFSRSLKEIETLAVNNSYDQVLFIGHKSYDHEAIYSFAKRLHFLNPKLKIAFIHQRNSYQFDDGVFDVTQDLPFTNLPNFNESTLVISFSDQKLPHQIHSTDIDLKTEPKVLYLPYYPTFYTVFPNTIINID